MFALFFLTLLSVFSLSTIECYIKWANLKAQWTISENGTKVVGFFKNVFNRDFSGRFFNSTWTSASAWHFFYISLLHLTKRMDILIFNEFIQNSTDGIARKLISGFPLFYICIKCRWVESFCCYITSGL